MHLAGLIGGAVEEEMTLLPSQGKSPFSLDDYLSWISPSPPVSRPAIDHMTFLSAEAGESSIHSEVC